MFRRLEQVTVISTVLSSRHPSEMRQQLGFLGHPKRVRISTSREEPLLNASSDRRIFSPSYGRTDVISW